ncbi:MAG TPA: nucleoside transporter C-terminal domain-containing protein [Candidatus Babeliales bacterium]|nr:nucleoside transporter C-terminal domain-containing protein [Candidatus Babeliales bacterium]
MSLISYLLEYNRYCNFAGIAAILFIAYLFSQHRSRVDFKLVIYGLLMQFAIGFFVLRTGIGQYCVTALANGVQKLYLFADEGSRFVFGSLVDPAAGPWGFLFAIKVLPVIIFFGAFMALLFHFGIVQRIVMVISYVVRPLLGTSGAETLCAISNSFLGQTEAPLLIRHYLKHMTKSEILVVMVSGMGTISGAILVVFVAMGVPAVPLLTASMMAIPSTLLIAKILYPETEKSDAKEMVEVDLSSASSNVFDAISSGTSDGLQLALNVGAMLISFIALLAFLNAILMGVGSLFGWDITLSKLFSFVFSPFGYLMGFDSDEAMVIGELIGVKVAVNEMVAYGDMLSKGLSERTINILTYALCGFSNFSCIGIQIGGIGALAPEKRKWLTELGLYAVLGGTLSNLLSAMMAGLLL